MTVTHVVLVLLAVVSVSSLAVALLTRRSLLRLRRAVESRPPAPTNPISATGATTPIEVRPPVDEVLTPTPLGPAPDEGLAGPVRSFAVSAAVSGSLVKVAALTYGLRRAMDEEHRMRVSYAFRRELRRQRRLRRRRRARSGPSRETGWHE